MFRRIWKRARQPLIFSKSSGETKTNPVEAFGVGGVATDDLDLDQEIEAAKDQLLSDLHQQVAVVEAVIDLKKDDFKDLLEGLEEKAAKEAAIPSIYPVAGGRVTSRFGNRRSPNSNRKEFHKGYDIGAPRGTPIKVTADGIVQFVGRNGGYGKMITVNHGNGYITRYAHADKLLKKRGSVVKKGEVIALVGNTGRSTGPHVHYEVRRNGVPVDPKNYFSIASAKKNHNRKVAQKK